MRQLETRLSTKPVQLGYRVEERREKGEGRREKEEGRRGRRGEEREERREKKGACTITGIGQSLLGCVYSGTSL